MPSVVANGAAGRPVALTTGKVVTCHGTFALMSAMNHGPDITVAALPSLNSDATSGPCAPPGTIPPATSPRANVIARAASGVAIAGAPAPSLVSPADPCS